MNVILFEDSQGNALEADENGDVFIHATSGTNDIFIPVVGSYKKMVIEMANELASLQRLVREAYPDVEGMEF